MTNERKLKNIKILHTVVWLIMAPATIYILYAGIYKIFNVWLWILIGILIVECLILFINKMTCPLTPLAMKYTQDRSDNFDIYLPKWLAKYNKLIFGTILIIGLILVIINIFNLY